ncbi:hypothetical protein HPODL_05240 [Ogataea parapolymorpha DL-1]|uniref:Thioredoxin domain-containing protein n=1 Tax=Ogataea parapolymorpha (strain ATCC 26012 / BCRC 20466 / JCM 22074 / NRRL Y-7560 / DL-1) TaxID=871575 RepID=W1QCP8_OGAPD|nr:hypothetical protein HPODL_05240 [Ogataea parapolymorpha DL-1]ESW98309.1 hypothetical protein HPODL_05240 [Ogataea parapolymorpha DL-1]
MPLTEKQRWILGGTLVFGAIAVYVQSSKNPLVKPKPVIWPPQSATKNRILLPVRNRSELQPLVPLHSPLLMNFVFRGDTASNKQTGALQRILTYDIDDSKLVSMVDVECDEPGNKGLLLDYQVTRIPSIVCLRNQIAQGTFVDDKLIENPEGEVDYERLKKWVESQAAEK